MLLAATTSSFANFNYGFDAQYSNYKEFSNGSKFMEDRGPLAGMFIDFTTELSPKWKLRSYARTLFSNHVVYDGGYASYDSQSNQYVITPFTYDSETFLIFDTETTFAYHGKKAKGIEPFIGFGYRRLKNPPPDSIPGFYYRYESYYYLPFGFNKDDYKVEARWLIYGENDSFNHEDKFHATLQQRDGYGFYFSKKLQLSKKFDSELYAEYWHISDSESGISIAQNGDTAPFMEPENRTISVGLKISSKLDI